MYKQSDRSQSSFLDFNQPMGLHMNPNNRWVKMADSVPWDVFEKKYSRLFKAKTGNVAKPVRMALGALIIQTKFQYSDRELVEQITENPYSTLSAFQAIKKSRLLIRVLWFFFVSASMLR